MKKNYLSPAIETIAITLSSAILDASANDSIKEDSLPNPFGARRRGMKAY